MSSKGAKTTAAALLVFCVSCSFTTRKLVRHHMPGTAPAAGVECGRSCQKAADSESKRCTDDLSECAKTANTSLSLCLRGCPHVVETDYARCSELGLRERPLVPCAEAEWKTGKSHAGTIIGAIVALLLTLAGTAALIFSGAK